MAINRVFAGNDKNNIVRVVPEGTKSGDFLLVNGRPCVAITDRGNAAREIALGEYVVTYPSGGVGLKDDEASLYTDGTYDLPVTGADDTTGQDVPVYIVDGTLTLTKPETDPVVFGYTNYPADNYDRKDGIAPVRIGA
jgi:hypothetical protein